MEIGIYLLTKIVCYVLILFEAVDVVTGSGSMYDPPNRAVMWKYGFPSQKNYNYMQLNCGGKKQLETGNPQCGLCGDAIDMPKDHEMGGKYGSGMITRYYPAGVKEISVKVELLAFEKGFFEFRLCPANNNTVTQQCLDEYQLPIKEGYLAGNPLRFFPKNAGDFRLTVAIPPSMNCERCVIQWRYHTANSWGEDAGTAKQGMGMGPQEDFYNCADIRIGGDVPGSVLNNPFFAPADASNAVTVTSIPVLVLLSNTVTVTSLPVLLLPSNAVTVISLHVLLPSNAITVTSLNVMLPSNAVTVIPLNVMLPSNAITVTSLPVMVLPSNGIDNHV